MKPYHFLLHIPLTGMRLDNATRNTHFPREMMS
jgi:hypothetical protein